MEDIFDFLKDLREHNDRDWFNGNKSRYLASKLEFEAYVKMLIEKLAVYDESVGRLQVKDCVYRIYRDTRFSPDKTPYKVHFGAYVCAGGGRNSGRAGYYLHLEPGSSMLGGGLYCPDGALLKRVRQDIYENIDEFISIIRDKEFKDEFGMLDEGDMLKKVPAPFPADFPEGDLLKRKHYDVVSRKPDSFFMQKDAMEQIVQVFCKMSRFNSFLNYTVDESGRVG